MNKLIQFFKKYDFPIHLFVGWTIICVKASTAFHTAAAKLKLRMLGCPSGKNFKIDGKLWIWAQRKGTIRIGDNVRINSRFGSNLVGLTNPAVFQCLGSGTILIGNHTGMSSGVLSARSGIRIGNHVKLGGNVRIFDHDYHSLDHEVRRDAARDGAEARSRPVVIGDDVFVGTNAIILKGVTVGERSIIQAGSVVTRDVPPDEIWGGNPAVRLSGKR